MSQFQKSLFNILIPAKICFQIHWQSSFKQFREIV